LIAFFDRSIRGAYIHDDAAVVAVLKVEHEATKLKMCIKRGWGRYPFDDRLKELGHTRPRFARRFDDRIY
jgi:hypothetical protein